MSVDVGSAVGYLDLDTTKFKAGFKGALAAMKDFENGSVSMSGMLKATGSAMASAGAQLSLKVTAPILAMGAGAILAAQNFETSFAKVKTIADTTAVPIESLSKGVVSLSTEIHASTADINEALYQTISATNDTANALSYVEIAAKLAKGGFTDTASAVDGATSVMNAYGQTGTEAFQKIADTMITTQNVGKTTVDELASSLFNVIPTAASLGISFEDVSAGLAAITAQGTPTATATTQMRQLFIELSKDGQAAAITFEEMSGKTFREFIASGGSVGEAIAVMDEAAKKNDKSLSDMFSSVEAGNAALQLSGVGADKYNSSMKAMEASSGATEKAFQTMSDTSSTSFEDLKISATNAAAAFGELMLPILSQVVEAITGLITMLSGMDQETLTMIVTILAVVASLGPVLAIIGNLITVVGTVVQVLNVLKTVMAAVNVVMAANPIGIIIIAIAALVAGLIYLYQTNEKVRAVIDSVFSTISATLKPVLELFTNNILPALTEGWNMLMTSIQPLLGILMELGGNLFAQLIPAFQYLYESILMPIGEFILNNFIRNFQILSELFLFLWQNVIVPLSEFLGEYFLKKFQELSEIITTKVIPVVQKIIEVFMYLWKNVFAPIMNFLVATLKPIIIAIFQQIGENITNLIKIFKSIIEFIVNVFTGQWEDAWNNIKDIFSSIVDIITGILDTLKGIIEGVISSVSEAISKVASLVSGTDGSHANGLDYVPYNGYMAELHQGERVLTAEENEDYDTGSGSGSGGNTFIINSPKAVDPYEANRVFRKLVRDIDNGLV